MRLFAPDLKARFWPTQNPEEPFFSHLRAVCPRLSDEIAEISDLWCLPRESGPRRRKKTVVLSLQLEFDSLRKSKVLRDKLNDLLQEHVGDSSLRIVSCWRGSTWIEIEGDGGAIDDIWARVLSGTLNALGDFRIEGARLRVPGAPSESSPRVARALPESSSQKPTDLGLLVAWRNGDRRAGRRLLERQLPTLQRFFTNKTPNGAEDLIQKTMLECIRSVDRFEPRAQFRTYLLAIAYRVLLHHFRHKARKDAPVDPLVDTVERLSAGPFTRLMRQTEKELLLQALRKLPLRLQTVFELYYWEQMSARECAIVLEIPEGAVKSLLRRGKELLREAVERGDGSQRERRGVAEAMEALVAEIRATLGEERTLLNAPLRRPR
jgi:RNA polymerase sigma-70 factor, ECF subfamily